MVDGEERRREPSGGEGHRDGAGRWLSRLAGQSPTEAEVLDALRGVLDPELGVGIVDLGLVYGVEVGDGVVRIRMTTTTPACPIGSYLEDAVRWTVLQLEGVLDVQIELTYEPLWSPERMSDAARAALGWLP
jgi:metal-sulfur cluster biosynthetic enzyme